MTLATRGSGRPLPPLFPRKFATWGNTRKLRAATDCQPFVSQLASRLPVARSSPSVRDSDDQDAILLNSVDDAERKSSEQIAPRSVLVRRPCFRQTSNRRFGCIHFFAKGSRSRRAALCVPTRDAFRLLESFFKVFKCASHGRLPHGCGDVLRTRQWSWRCRRRLDRDARESPQTMPLPRPRRPRVQDSESVRQRVRLVLRQRAEALQPVTVWHPWGQRNSLTTRQRLTRDSVAKTQCRQPDVHTDILTPNR